MTTTLPRPRALRHDRRGAALILTLLVSIAIAATALIGRPMSRAALEITEVTAK